MLHTLNASGRLTKKAAREMAKAAANQTAARSAQAFATTRRFRILQTAGS
jgi:hypothetical protein